jgi:hypothetical protein
MEEGLSRALTAAASAAIIAGAAAAPGAGAETAAGAAKFKFGAEEGAEATDGEEVDVAVAVAVYVGAAATAAAATGATAAGGAATNGGRAPTAGSARASQPRDLERTSACPPATRGSAGGKAMPGSEGACSWLGPTCEFSFSSATTSPMSVANGSESPFLCSADLILLMSECLLVALTLNLPLWGWRGGGG